MTLRKTLWLLPLAVAACSDNDNAAPPPFKDLAVVAARAPDYSSGAVSLIDQQPPYASTNNLAPTTSDIVVRSGGDHYFLIERFGSDRIKRFDPENPQTPAYTYSTQDAGDTQSSNPYDLISAAADKAYLLRYGSGSLWIVDPSATDEASFKIGEIDLSALDDDGIPEMSAAILRGGRLYVALQRLENFAATRSGQLAVIDVATDTLVDTIDLPVRSPSRLLADPEGERLFVVADGGFDGSFAPLYEGGIAVVDTAEGEATLLIDDGTPEDAPYGQIADAVVVDAQRGYFIGSAGFGDDQTLYRFDPDALATPVAVAGLAGVGLSSLAVDAKGLVWVGRSESAAPGVTVLGFAAGAETVLAPLVDTVLTPINIDFVTVAEAAR